MNRDIAAILEDQKAYYSQRAGEYDEWFHRLGRYDRGEDHNRDWFSEIALMRESLAGAAPFGDVLEFAAGTGLWTAELQKGARSVHCLDASSEVLEINRDRNGGSGIHFEAADIFAWKPDRKFDFVFFSFWLSHVPEEKFASFWDLVRAALKPDGRWFMIDSRPDEFSRAIDHRITPDTDIVRRKLNDGSEFDIVKRFFQTDELEERLARLGWRSEFAVTPRFFIYGSGKPSDY